MDSFTGIPMSEKRGLPVLALVAFIGWFVSLVINLLLGMALLGMGVGLLILLPHLLLLIGLTRLQKTENHGTLS